jgi:hypothetical protein
VSQNSGAELEDETMEQGQDFLSQSVSLLPGGNTLVQDSAPLGPEVIYSLVGQIVI